MWRLSTTVCAIVLCLLTGCGGGSDSSTTSTPPAGAGNTTTAPTGSNVLPIMVQAGPQNNVNVPTASVTVCAPGGTSCQTIDNVLIDTGSIGLRVFASALTPALAQALQQQSGTTAECTQFADGVTWGPLRQAALQVGGEAVDNLAIQVIGDNSFAPVPAACAATGPVLDSVNSFGNNGVLGVGLFLQDCGPACAQRAIGVYYTCAASCQSVTLPLAQQVQNPVSLFNSDNNGVEIILPSVPPEGAASVAGSLVFGIGTQSNNPATASVVLTTDPNTGQFTTVYKNRVLPRSFIDSGSNGFFFSDSSIPACNSGFYCPPATLTANATNQGTNGATSAVTFNVANANALFSSNATAFNSLAGTNADAMSFDWGLSFFFGRTVFTAIEQRTTPQGTGPYFAY